LATFLDVDVEDSLKQEIVNACHFDKMSKEKTFYPDKFILMTKARSAQTDELDKTPDDYLASMIRPEFRFYRKGMFLLLHSSSTYIMSY